MSCSLDQDLVDADLRSPAAERSPTLLRSSKISNWLSWTLSLAGVWRKRAQGRRALLRLNDHLLKDIGISRLDADIEATKSFWQR